MKRRGILRALLALPLAGIAAKVPAESKEFGVMTIDSFAPQTKGFDPRAVELWSEALAREVQRNSEWDRLIRLGVIKPIDRGT